MHFQIKQFDREESGYKYLENLWTVWKFLTNSVSLDLLVINGDKMQQHQNENGLKKDS